MSFHFTEKIYLPSKITETVMVLVLCLVTGVVITVSIDLRLAYQVAMVAVFFLFAAFIVFPQKKRVLVFAWILVHPLSIEKVFQVGSPLMPEFVPPALVISGSDIILCLLLLVLLFESLVLQRVHVWKLPEAMTPLLLFVVWNLMVFLVRPTTTSSVLALLHLGKMTLFMLIMVSAISTKEDYKLVLQAIAVAVALQVLAVGYTAFSGDFVRFSTKITGTAMSFSGAESGQSHFRATGTVGHVNQEASFLTFFGLSLVGLPFLYRRFRRLLIWIIICGATGAIVLTFSRSAWLAVLFSIVILLGLSFYYRLLTMQTWAYLFPIILMCIVAFPVVSPPVIDRIFHGDDGATSSRMRAMQLALDLTQKHPVMGVGGGHFVKASLDYYPPRQTDETMSNVFSKPNGLGHRLGRMEAAQVPIGSKTFVVPLPVHNKFLLVLSELGIVGLLLFLWFQWRIFKHIKESIKQSIRQNQNSLVWSGIALMAAFGATQVYMSLDLFSDDKSMQILLFVPILAMALHQISKQGGKA